MSPARKRSEPAAAKAASASKKTKPAFPETLPLDLDGAFDLQRTFEPQDDTKARAPAPKAKLGEAARALRLPPEIVALYGRCDGIGNVKPLKDLASLQRRFAKEVKSAIEDGDDEMEGNDLEIQDFQPTAALVAIGFDGGGDTLFVDPRRTTKEGTLPVLRFVHDESCVVRVEAPSVGAYVAWQILLAWEATPLPSGKLVRLMKAERKRGLPTKRRGT